jgi:hypothetical protein
MGLAALIVVALVFAVLIPILHFLFLVVLIAGVTFLVFRFSRRSRGRTRS